MVSSKSARPGRRLKRRGVGWFLIMLVAFMVTSYLIRGSDSELTGGRTSSGVVDRSSRVSPLTRGALLREVEPEVWESPAGLRYGPGSREQHRLEHIARHFHDIPDREIHGVFSGTPEEVLGWIDEAYRLFLDEATGVSVERQEDRTQITAVLNGEIGFVGGMAGERAGNPKTRVLRLVLEDRSVITAFPDWPSRSSRGTDSRGE